MFSQGIVQTPYMSYAYDSLNQYNYRNFNEKQPIYQKQLDMYHYTRQINPISIAPLHPSTLDPSNLPCDVRTMIYAQGDANNNELLNLRRTVDNDSFMWRDHLPAKAGYHTQQEQTLNYIRPSSSIQAGHNTSVIDYHGYILDR